MVVGNFGGTTALSIVLSLLLVGGLSFLGAGSPLQTGVDCPGECDDVPTVGDTGSELQEGEETTTTQTLTPQPDEANYSYAGSGQTATDTFELAGGLVTFDLSHAGSDIFTVRLLDVDTGEETTVIKSGGGFNGTVPMSVPEGEYVLNIDTDGQWEAHVEQPRYSAAEVDPLPIAADGSDFAVLGPMEFDGAARLSIDAETGSNTRVVVRLLDLDGQEVDLLVNEVGSHEGSTVFVAEGAGLVSVETVGEWNVTIEDA